MTWFDLSPLRPDEYARTSARRWTEAATYRQAYEQGIRDATDERHVTDALFSAAVQA